MKLSKMVVTNSKSQSEIFDTTLDFYVYFKINKIKVKKGFQSLHFLLKPKFQSEIYYGRIFDNQCKVCEKKINAKNEMKSYYQKCEFWTWLSNHRKRQR
jgi:hypothetical protein